MTIGTLARYLFIGQREAIVRIAESPRAVWLGLLVVLSAALAREYDGEDLWHAPWHLALPAAASVITSLMLFTVVYAVTWRVRPRWTEISGVYRSFLGLYWMTAPLAWLYAIPVERMGSAAEATAWNLWLLGIVSLWRVVLMVRVVSVLFNIRAPQALFVVMLFADTVALFVLHVTPLPVLSIMGGIRLTESESMILSTSFWIAALGILSWPLWLIGSATVARNKEMSWQPAITASSGRRRVGPSAWVLGVAAILVWVPVLPLTQREQQRRRLVESDLKAGDIDAALRRMAAHERDEFPPHWDPPPRIGYGERHPPILDVVETVLAHEHPPWVREMFLEKFHNARGQTFHYYFFAGMDNREFARYLAVLEQLPQDSVILEDWREQLVREADNEDRTDHLRARLRELLNLEVIEEEGGDESDRKTGGEGSESSN